MKYDNNHWQELITTIVNRIGADAFLRLSAAVLKDEHLQLSHELKDLANEYTRGSEERHCEDCERSDADAATYGKEKNEWKHEAVEAMKLKR